MCALCGECCLTAVRPAGADGPCRPLRFAAHRQPLCWNFMCHSRIVLSVGGSVRYMVRNLRCTVTIDSVLASSKTQNAFLFTVYTIFRHDYPLAVEPASTPRPLVQKKLWEILYLLICSFLRCLSWLLCSRVRKFRRDLWITLYIFISILYMFRANLCSSSGESVVLIQLTLLMMRTSLLETCRESK